MALGITVSIAQGIREVSEDVLSHLVYHGNELLMVKKFQDIKRNNRIEETLMHWKGFRGEENDWVEIASLREHVPVILEKYITEMLQNGITRQREIAVVLLTHQRRAKDSLTLRWGHCWFFAIRLCRVPKRPNYTT